MAASSIRLSFTSLIHRYEALGADTWRLLRSSGSAWEQAALTVERWRELGEEEPDWWAAARATPLWRLRLLGVRTDRITRQTM